MAHDFAKQHSTSSTSKKRRASSKNAATKVSQSRTHWPWFFSGLLTGLFAAFIGLFSFYRPGMIQSPANQLATQEEAGENREEGTDFTFYDRLSEAEVVVDVVAVELEPEQEEDPTIYRVQAASFNTRADAENLLAQIHSLGLEANIFATEVLGQTFYRVQAGPFTGNSNAEDAIDLLAGNNISGAIKIRVR